MGMSAPNRSVWSFGFFGLFASAALAFAPLPLFAQHGGGGHIGGGHFSGGGGHVSSATHVSSAPHLATPPAIYRAPAISSPAAPHMIVVPPQSFARPSQFGAPVVGNHILMPPVVPGAPSNARTTVGYPAVPPPNWRVTNVTGPSMRFEGQGDEIWQSPAGQALGQVHRSPILGPVGYPVRPPIGGPGYGFRGGFPIFGVPIYGGPFFGGVGFGFGAGWGPACGPYSGWGFGCNGLSYYNYGYGNYDYGYGNVYDAPPVSNWPSSDYGSQPETPPSNYSGPFLYESGTPEQAQSSIRAENFVTMLYLKDGEVYALDDYWVEDGKLHYTSGSAEDAVDIDQIDMQKTVEVNASRGVSFTLKPKPSGDSQGNSQPADSRGQSIAPGPLQPVAPYAPAERPQAATPR